MKVIGCDLFLDLDIFNLPKHFIDELKEKYIVKEVNTYNTDHTDISVFMSKSFLLLWMFIRQKCT